MTYAYGMKNAPAVGGGLGGLPRREAGGGVVTRKFNLPNDTISSSFSVPSNVQAIAFDGANILSSDVATDRIYIHDGLSSTTTSFFSTPGGQCGGLHFDGTNLISSDYGVDRIYIHDGISSSVLSNFSISGADGVFDITIANGNLVSVDLGTHTVKIHNGMTSTITESFAVDEVMGVAFDGFNLITSSATDDIIRIHDGVSGRIMKQFSAPSTSIAALAFADENLVSCDTGTDLIYVHDFIPDGIETVVIDGQTYVKP